MMLRYHKCILKKKEKYVTQVIDPIESNKFSLF
jgi:hypothetical protein